MEDLTVLSARLMCNAVENRIDMMTSTETGLNPGDKSNQEPITVQLILQTMLVCFAVEGVWSCLFVRSGLFVTRMCVVLRILVKGLVKPFNIIVSDSLYRVDSVFSLLLK